MADDHHRPRPLRERPRDPRPRRRVQVVRGLVEQQQVVPPRDQLRQRQLRLLPTRERARVLPRDVPAEAEHSQQGTQHPLLRIGLLPHVREHAHPGPDPLVLLRVVPERHPMAEPERPGIRLALSREDAQQTRLARTVQSHHQQPLMTLDLECDVAKHQRTAVTLGQTIRPEHNASAVRRLGKADLHLSLAARCNHALRLHALDPREDRLRLLGALLGLAAHHLREQAQALDLRLLPMRERGQPLLL